MKISALFFTLFTCQIYAQSDSININWAANYKLTWNDFKGNAKTQKTDESVAITHTRIKVATEESEKKTTFVVTCIFDKQNSWTTVGDAYILNHEQIHFDIAEIYARILRKKLSMINKKAQNIEAKVNELHQLTFNDCNKFQVQYDTETNHSKNKMKQQIWNEKVRKLLADYSAFATETVIIKK